MGGVAWLAGLRGPLPLNTETLPLVSLARWSLRRLPAKIESRPPPPALGTPAMEYRRLGHSGFNVPALTLGTGTFGGGTELFKAWGETDVKEATRLIDVCLDAGLNMF